MADVEVLDIDTLPPGTVPLEKLHDNGSPEIILHPQPSEDPNDPLNWSKFDKALNFGLSTFYALMAFVLLDIGTVIYGPLMDELGFSVEVLNWSFGSNTAGLAVGCVMFIPFALKFGRRPVYLISIAVCLATAIWQAKMTNAFDQYGSNLVSGLAGAVAETICQMTIADLFFVHQRATANGIYLLLVNVGVFLAPVAAGYAADSQGWRWIWWWNTIFLAVCLVAFIFLYEDTKYTPAPLAHKSSMVTRKPSEAGSSKTGPKVVHAVTETGSEVVPVVLKRKSYLQRLSLSAASPGGFWVFFRHSYQPFEMLFTIPAVAFTALIYGSLLAWFSIVLSTLSVYMTLPPYNFSSSGIGLMNLAPFIGSVFGTGYAGWFSDWLIVRLAKRNKGIFEPEMRLWLALPIIVIGPGSVAMFGLTMAAGTHWILPAIGSALFGFTFTTFADTSLTYLMDSYKDLVGDALVAVAFVRNAFATIMVFSLQPWIDRVGLQNVYITSTMISFVLFATTIPMLIWGKSFRIRTTGQFHKLRKRQFSNRD